MAKKNLHPSVQKFKEFVKNHPELIQEVRKGNTTWQELYEDWYLLGEDDPKWNSSETRENKDSVEEQEKKTDWLGTIMGAVKNMDPEQLQGQISNISQALGAIQGVLSQFQGNKGGQQSVKSSGPGHPFSFRKD
ncbi:YlbD family protein [Bacillus sp. JJ1609]|uniref:YlbD family protein n=1 Tax=Bacillus sp. JJ1609 TaxID=3122977 RepID=UPI002FFDCA03